MPIDYKKRFIFVHIPKTAGTSIESHLFNIPLNKDDIIDYSSLPLEYQNKHLIGNENQFTRMIHYPIKKIIKVKHNININDFFIFCFVRNPFDRLVSEYHYFRFPNIIPFKDYVKYIVKQTFDLGKLEKWFSAHLLPQYDFISINDKIYCNFIGRFENLEEDYKFICKKLDIKEHGLPHYKKSRRDTDYRIYYDDETRAIVENCYKKDLENFNYEY